MTAKIETAIKTGFKTGISTPLQAGAKAVRNDQVAPFISVLIAIATLFSIVFCKMEVRRMGYSVLKLSREERQMRDKERLQIITLAKMTRPERLQAVAQNRLTFKKPESGQIIQMTEQGIALRQ